MKFISHRGAAGPAKENSADSIMIADRYHPRFIEVDINQTKDNVWIVLHGDLQRFYSGKKLDMTFRQVKKMHPTLLTLQALFQLPIRNPLLLDIKIKHLDDEFFEILTAAPKHYRSAFASIHISTLLTLQKKYPRIETFISQPYSEGPYRAIELANKYGFTGCCLNKWWAGPIPYHLAKRYNKELLIYTVNSSLTMHLIFRFFPEMTIISNHPERCIKV